MVLGHQYNLEIHSYFCTSDFDWLIVFLRRKTDHRTVNQEDEKLLEQQPKYILLEHEQGH